MIVKGLTSLLLASSLLTGCVSMGNRGVEDTPIENKRVSTAFIICSNEDVLRDCLYTPNATNPKLNILFQGYTLAGEDKKKQIRLLVGRSFTESIRDEVYRTLDILDNHLVHYLQIESFKRDYKELFPDINRTTPSTNSSPDDTQRSFY